MAKDEREMHVKAGDEAAQRAQELLKRESESNAKRAAEEPNNPVRASINIVFMKDGTFHMDGPWHDRILFEGLWSIAAEAKNDHFKRLANEVAQRAAPRVQPVHMSDAAAAKLRTKT
jgi:hypothetical protein